MIETLNEEQVKKLRGMVKEAVDSIYRADAEKGLRKEIAERAVEELEIPKKLFTQVCRVVYKQNRKKVNEEITAVLDLADIVEGPQQ